MAESSSNPRGKTYVALDLETTGLNPDQDTIIEVGAVKFQGQQVLDTFQTLVNPYRDLSDFIQRLTGIAQKNVDRAPPFGAVAGELRDFIGPLPVVGHNISFDLKFLSSHGLQLDNEVYDTWDLASILMPYFTAYSLPGLAVELRAVHTRPHRALPDAQATHQVFMSLLERANSLDPAIAAYIHQLAFRASWPLWRLFGDLPSLREAQDKPLTPDPSPLRGRAATGRGEELVSGLGLDIAALEKRLGRADRAVRPRGDTHQNDEEELAGYLSPGGVFSRTFPDFEHRPQQVEMMRAVASAINSGEHLIMEGGTGVGKSLAYLLPAVLYSLKNGTRVVVSTNTINLQEQLIRKDIPALINVLEENGIISAGEFRAVPLKGRANYLCLRRWNNLARGESLSSDEARLLSKTLVWLKDTISGDRGEINLSGKDALTWSRVSAGEKGQCPGMRGQGACFLRTARERAEGANMIIVNHALLLSDLALGGGLLPEYQHLIVDEAHHLEEEATRQLGFQVSQNRLNEELDALGRLLGDVRLLLRPRPEPSAPSLSSGSAAWRHVEGGPSPSGIQMQRGEDLAAELDSRWSRRIRDSWDRFWSVAENFLDNHHEDGGDQAQLSIARSTRAQPGWSEVEIAWENVDVGLNDGVRRVERLRRFLETVPVGGPVDTDTLMAELSTWQEGLEELRERLKTLLAAPADGSRIDWIARVDDARGDSSDGRGSRSHIVLHSAPLDVGPELNARLYSRKSSVILTSATLATQASPEPSRKAHPEEPAPDLSTGSRKGSFDYIRERIGLAESKELLVGSPFNYRRAALLLIPDDMPTPDAWGYQEAMENVLVGLGKTLKGHTLVLFTSHSALRGAARAIRGSLEAEGIRVLAQGVDGSPRQILQSFSENSMGVILGTSSFWEGVDVSGGVLKALVLARLPFHVPTEPIFSARSAQYEDAFHRYAVPQAVLRFRQGIGRLIRSSQDRGAIVVLDRRIIARPYGKAFINSIPPCTVKWGPMTAIPGHAADWVGSGLP